MLTLYHLIIILVLMSQCCRVCGLILSRVENIAKKNRSRFPIAVLLTTLICSHKTTTNICFVFCACKFKCLGACNIPLERNNQDLSNGNLQAPKYLKCQLVSQEKQICNYLAIAEHGGQKNRNGIMTAVLFGHVFY